MGVESGAYHGLLHLEPRQTKETMGPFIAENALSDIPIFGPGKADVDAIAESTVEESNPAGQLLVDELASSTVLPESFATARSLAERLKALRRYIWGINHPHIDEDEFDQTDHPTMLSRLQADGSQETSQHSSRSLHEALIKSTMETAGFPKPAQVILDHIMLFRAQEKYLFDCRVNCAVVDDDPWLKSVWGWIGGNISPSVHCTSACANVRQTPKQHAMMVACWPTRWISAIWASARSGWRILVSDKQNRGMTWWLIAFR